MGNAKKLNVVAEMVLDVITANCGHCGPEYFAEKRAELAGMDKAETLFWASRKLGRGNLADLAERLGVSLDDLDSAARVFRSIY